MKRNYDQFPDDDNGDVLWDMLQDGDNLDDKERSTFQSSFLMTHKH